MHNESKPLQALMFLPMMMEMPVTGNAQKLHLVNLILMKRNTLTRGGERVRLGGGVGTKVMKKALSQISKSPFTRGIEKVKLPRRFHQPTYSMYNGRTDPVEHVSQFKQKMAVHSQDEALLCRVFPSSLGSMLMRWFDGLRTNSISSFKKLTQSFCSRFITCSRVPQPLDSLLSMTMREGKSVKSYAERYWEMFNEINDDLMKSLLELSRLAFPPNMV